MKERVEKCLSSYLLHMGSFSVVSRHVKNEGKIKSRRGVVVFPFCLPYLGVGSPAHILYVSFIWYAENSPNIIPIDSFFSFGIPVKD